MKWRPFEVLLTLAPRGFRDRYGPEVLETLRKRVLSDPTGRKNRWVREFLGLAATVARLHWIRIVRQNGEGKMGGRAMLDATAQDIRFSVRSLKRNPGFGLSAVLVIALGIGATTAIFSAANSYFFRPLPFANGDRLMMLYETNPEFGWTHAQAAPANVLDWRERVAAFEDVTAFQSSLNRIPFVRDGEAEILSGSAVAGNFFSTLGVRPHLGRFFQFEETWAGSNTPIVLSHGLWATHFGSDAGIVGRTIDMGGRSAEVIGIAPADFRFPRDETQLWYPLSWARDARDQVWFRRAHSVRAVASLAPGMSAASADAEFQAVVRSLQGEYPETNRVMGAGMMPLRDFLIREIRTPLLILLAASGLLLLLACVNVANLMLLRSDDRSREVAVRHALGARAGRVIRLMLTESVTIGVVGGAFGMALGWVGVRSMERLTRVGIEGATSLTLDGRVLAFTVITAISCGMLFGVLPAVKAGGYRVAGAMRAGGRGRGRRALRTSNALVSLEVALAVVLVAGAGLLVRSYLLLRDVDPGFEAEGALAVRFTVPAARYQSRSEVLSFYDRYLEALEARPGILRAGLVGQLPLNGQSWSSQFQAEGWPPDRVGFEIVHRRADAGYFEALDIPLLRGRGFEATDEPDGPLVVVVNETFAREHFPGEDPVGQRIAYDRAATPESHWYEIVGVVGDQHQESPGIPPRAEAFEYAHQDWGRSNWVVVKTDGDPLAAVGTVRTVLREADPLIPLSSVRSLQEVWSRSMAQERFILTILGAFGGLALLLAVVGVHTVSAQAARRQSHELGVRMALGAAAGDVIALVLRRGALVVGAGVVAGLALALMGGRALSSQLYTITATDPVTILSVVLGLSAVGLLASYLPARRATRIDPVSSLRTE